MTRFSPNRAPELARRVPPPAAAEFPSRSGPPQGGGRGWLQNALPEPSVLQGSFSRISVPATWTADGKSAWYPLIYKRFTPDNAGAGLGLFMVSWDLFAPDASGLGGTNSLAWGTADGRAAGIVIAKNPQIDAAGVWTPHPALVAGIESDTNYETVDGMYIHDITLPPGRFTDTTPPRDRGFIPYGWTATRFGPGDKLVAALVIRGSVIENSSGTKWLYGKGVVRCHLCDPSRINSYQ